MSDIRADTISDAAGTGPITLTKQSAAKAWINFNGTGTVAVRDSLNVSGLVDNGSGDCDVSFTSNMSDDDYSVSGSAMRDSANISVMCVYGSTTYGNTIFNNKVRLNVRDNSNNSVDGLAVFASIHGDLA